MEDDNKMQIDEVQPRRVRRKTAKVPAAPQNSRGTRGKKRAFKDDDYQPVNGNHTSRGTKAGPGPHHDLPQSPAAQVPSGDEQRKAKRRKQAGATLGSTLPIQPTTLSPAPTVPTSLSSASSLSSPSSSSSSASSRHPSSHQISQDSLRESMGIPEERALQFARDHGLWRTIQTFQGERESTPATMKQIFEMDAFWAKRSQATRASFQEDIIEVFGHLFRSAQPGSP